MQSKMKLLKRFVVEMAKEIWKNFLDHCKPNNKNAVLSSVFCEMTWQEWKLINQLEFKTQ